MKYSLKKVLGHFDIIISEVEDGSDVTTLINALRERKEITAVTYGYDNDGKTYYLYVYMQYIYYHYLIVKNIIDDLTSSLGLKMKYIAPGDEADK